MLNLKLFAVVLSLAVMSACGGSNSNSASSPSSTPTIASVTASCAASNVPSGQTSQCSAAVMGSGSFSSLVTWTASAGTISTSGLFTAQVVSISTSVVIVATSASDKTRSATVTITVNPVQQANNVQPIVVDSGPQPASFVVANEAFVTVTVCAPGTDTCQDIDHVLLDTGSSGLRLLSSAAGGELSLVLPNLLDSNGNPLMECLVFLDGYVWGNVATADIRLADEKAAAAPVQVIIPFSVPPAVPGSCSNQTIGPNEGNSLMALGANGIIGLGVFQQDCGPACTTANGTIPPFYYDCTDSGCTPIYTTLVEQVTNPVVLFATDNNGVLIQLPTVSNGGSLNVAGSLIFGIGTQSNNRLGTATVYTVPDSGANAGDITTTFNGTSYPSSFIDSGSNGIFFLDPNSTGVPLCAKPADSWYCPAMSPYPLSATNQGLNENKDTVNFSIEDASALFSTSNTAFSTLGGPNAGAFDWGLTFFFGRSVFTAIENLNTPGGAGPYYAY